MKYYLVNYIILDNKTVAENENVGIELYTFANIDDFKILIAEMKNSGTGIEHIVIKSYKEISEEAYNALSVSTA